MPPAVMTDDEADAAPGFNPDEYFGNDWTGSTRNGSTWNGSTWNDAGRVLTRMVR